MLASTVYIVCAHTQMLSPQLVHNRQRYTNKIVVLGKDNLTMFKLYCKATHSIFPLPVVITNENNYRGCSKYLYERGNSDLTLFFLTCRGRNIYNIDITYWLCPFILSTVIGKIIDKGIRDLLKKLKADKNRNS